MSKFSKNLIIKNLELIKNLEKNKLKHKAYTTVIDNLKSYPHDITSLKDLENIKGIGVNIHKMLKELHDTGEISYIKKLNNTSFNKENIIKLLEIIRNYEDEINEKKKSKAYTTVIDNLKSYPHDITTLKDLENIKGIGEYIYKMLEEFYNKGKVSYIEKIQKHHDINKIKLINLIENICIDYKNNIDIIKKYSGDLRDLLNNPLIRNDIKQLINDLFKNEKQINTNFSKETIIKNLEIIKDYETYNNERFKVKAYTTAINNIIAYNKDITNLSDIANIDGIGNSIYDKIKELYETGKISYIEEHINNDKTYNFKQILLSIYGIGPINAKKIIEKGITNIDELKKNNSILNAKQQIGLKYYEDMKIRIPLEEFKNHIDIIEKDLKKDKIEYEFVGSYRRNNKSMGDIDLLIKENKKFNLKKFVTKLIDDKYIIDVLASGKNKFMGIVKIDNQPARRFDILIAPENEYYFSLLYFTGSNLFNIGLRKYVKDKFNLSLSEHGFQNLDLPIKSEEDIFKYLKLRYIKPNDRNVFNI